MTRSTEREREKDVGNDFFGGVTESRRAARADCESNWRVVDKRKVLFCEVISK